MDTLLTGQNMLVGGMKPKQALKVQQAEIEKRKKKRYVLPQNCSYLVKKTDIEGERVFEVTVLEFPHVAVYEDTASEALAVAMDVVEGLIEMNMEDLAEDK